ncbi:hypothetical protein [Paenibacillus campi]|uniref:hypothetical protein n=1 Tax=Paenibacillus campi TaxID=3106031 RepID=UPI002AFFDD84|nr:hypothetical protein [Paenibacillus sp. SGZ-1009]
MFSKYEIELIEELRELFLDGMLVIEGVRLNCLDMLYHLVRNKTYLDNFTVKEIESLEDQLRLYQDFMLSLNVTFNEEDKQLYFKLEQLLKTQKSKSL